MMKNITLSQRFLTIPAIVFGLTLAAFLSMGPSFLVWATSDPVSGPVSGPITPTPTPDPISSPITPTNTPTPTFVPTNTPTPTAMPTPSATPTPKMSPTPTPTVVPSTSPTPTVVPSTSPTPTAMPTPSATPTPTPVTMYVMDNTDPRFSTRGVWNFTNAGSGFWGSNYEINKKDHKNALAVWTPNLPTGKYMVYVRYVGGADKSSKVKYTVQSANGRHEYFVDQRRNGGQWVKLGYFAVTMPFGNYVEVSNSPQGTVVADAVLFVKVY